MGREGQHQYSEGAKKLVAGRRVLITGAGGSIGSELARQVARLGPSALLLLDRDETLLQSIQFDIWGDGLLDSDALVLTDIRDQYRLNREFTRLEPDVVFHAAALKHLTLLENFPVEAMKTNVFGTRNVAAAANAAGTSTFVNVSTDKAADPASILGVSKHLAEMITSSFGFDMAVANVRFGNVLGSRGSFLAMLRRQLEEGTPVTITDPAAERFFMTIPEAAGLVVEAAGLAHVGESTFVLDMGDPVRIVDLVSNYAQAAGVDDYDVVYTGLRPGEKLTEVVFAESEEIIPTDVPRVFRTENVPMSAADYVALSQLELATTTAASEADRTVVSLVQALVPEYRPAFAPAKRAPRVRPEKVHSNKWGDA